MEKGDGARVHARDNEKLGDLLIYTINGPINTYSPNVLYSLTFITDSLFLWVDEVARCHVENKNLTKEFYIINGYKEILG